MQPGLKVLSGFLNPEKIKVNGKMSRKNIPVSINLNVLMMRANMAPIAVAVKNMPLIVNMVLIHPINTSSISSEKQEGIFPEIT